MTKKLKKTGSSKKSRYRAVQGSKGKSKLSVKHFCEVVGMSRQNYYKTHNSRRKQFLDESCILALVRQERAVQPGLGARKLLHML